MNENWQLEVASSGRQGRHDRQAQINKKPDGLGTNVCVDGLSCGSITGRKYGVIIHRATDTLILDPTRKRRVGHRITGFRSREGGDCERDTTVWKKTRIELLDICPVGTRSCISNRRDANRNSRTRTLRKCYESVTHSTHRRGCRAWATKPKANLNNIGQAIDISAQNATIMDIAHASYSPAIGAFTSAGNRSRHTCCACDLAR